MTAPVSLENVCRVYGGRPIFAGITRDFSGVNLITGANGAGKSTLLRIVAGLSRPTSGNVRTRGSIGYLAHAPFVYPGFSARENLEFWARAVKLRGVDISSMLERMNLLKAADTRARVFSRGMLQRLGLARTFMGDPQILLLDEPASGLDAPSRGLLQGEITAAARRGACILLVSHDEADDALADRAFVIRKGRLEEA